MNDFDFNSVKKNNIDNTKQSALSFDRIYVDLIRDEILPTFFNPIIKDPNFPIYSRTYLDDSWHVNYNNGIFECWQQRVIDNFKLGEKYYGDSSFINFAVFAEGETIFTRFNNDKKSIDNMLQIYREYKSLIKNIKIMSSFKYDLYPSTNIENALGVDSIFDIFYGFKDVYSTSRITEIKNNVDNLFTRKICQKIYSHTVSYYDYLNPFASLYSKYRNDKKIYSDIINIYFNKTNSIILNIQYSKLKDYYCGAINNFSKNVVANPLAKINIFLYKSTLKNFYFTENQMKDFEELCDSYNVKLNWL